LNTLILEKKVNGEVTEKVYLDPAFLQLNCTDTAAMA